MRRLVRGISSYGNSHRYELHALLAGFFVFLLMFAVKIPIKRWTKGLTVRKFGIPGEKPEDGLAEEEKELAYRAYTYRKRLNLVLMVITVVMSFFMFKLVSMISPIIDFSWFSATLTAFFALDFYAVFDLILGGTTCQHK